MGREFERTDRVETDASPDDVWTAIATGPGVDSWFMGRNEVDATTVRQEFGGYRPAHRVTAWEPLHRFAFRSDEAPDGRFVAYEFLVEGREGSGTVVRIATSGFLPGDDWEAEYEAMTKGNDLFFATLATYLRHFAGRTATPLTVFGPVTPDWPAARATLHRALELPAEPRPGDRAHAAGLLDGEVYFANEHTLGIRAADGLYRFLKGFAGPIVAGHHLFDHSDTATAEKAWQTWLGTTFSRKDPS
jgi:uncharacterized protein YndB with AHSA1/START domain